MVSSSFVLRLTPAYLRLVSTIIENPCLSRALKVNVQEIRGPHLHERVQVSSQRQCCETCWKKKGCALYTYVGDNDLGQDKYCRLTYGWDPKSGSATPDKCSAKITTGYEDTDGANGIWWDFGPGPCGVAEDCKGSCLSA